MKILEPNESRSSTPRDNLFGCQVSPMPNQEVLVMSYAEQSPCSPNISPDSQMIGIDQTLSNGKYLATSPPDAHRYIVETYRGSSDDSNQERFVVDARCSNETLDFRQLAVETQRIPTDLQRIRIDDQSLDVYGNIDETYRGNPIDLQRVPDFNLHPSEQRDEGDLPRLSMEAIRHLNDRSGSHMELAQDEAYISSAYKDSRSGSIGQSPRTVQEPTGRARSDSQRLIQESLLREYFNPRSTNDTFRGIDERLLPEDIHYTSSEGERLLFRRQDSDVYLTTNVPSDSIRVEGSETPHSLGSENLRVSPESVCVMPENLCLSEPNPVQIMPENLHIDQNLDSVPGASDEVLMNRRIISHPHQIDLTPVRSHYESNGHLMAENTLSFRENVRAPSPQYIENYHLGNNLVSQAPPTPAPSVPPIGEAPSTPIPTRYYSSIAYTPATPHQSHLVVQPHQFNSYINEGMDDRESIPMTVEERIERGYHDIKPFDQEYPVAMPVMHLTHESLSVNSGAKQPAKLKKPKEPKPPRAPIIHTCCQCDRTFKNSTQLKNHMWRHTGEKPFTCEECGSKFTQQGNLRAHKRIHTGERPYHCTDCKASFTQLSTLKTHQKIHSDERPYKCSECDAAFRQVANLKTHQVTHTGERPHKCDLCEKAFTQKSNLKAHKNRVHCPDHERTGSPKRGRRKAPVAIKPFTCTECGSKFTVMSNLKIHMKLHGGEKPFECEFCGAGFAQRSNLKTHVHRMHGKHVAPTPGTRRFRCDECPSSFRLKRCLKTHKKKRHQIKSLKLKILRQSQLMNEDGSVSNDNDDEIHSCDEDGEGGFCRHEELSDDEEDSPLSVKVELSESEFLGHIDKENLPTDSSKSESPSLAYTENPEDALHKSSTFDRLDEKSKIVHEDPSHSTQSNNSSLNGVIKKDEPFVSYS